MTRVFVCPLSKVDATVAESGAGALVSLLSPGLSTPRPDAIAPERHLQLGLHDIVEAREGHVLARPEQIETLLAFFRAWERQAPQHQAPLVIHCYAGVSRSTACCRFDTTNPLHCIGNTGIRSRRDIHFISKRLAYSAHR